MSIDNFVVHFLFFVIYYCVAFLEWTTVWNVVLRSAAPDGSSLTTVIVKAVSRCLSWCQSLGEGVLLSVPS